MIFFVYIRFFFIPFYIKKKSILMPQTIIINKNGKWKNLSNKFNDNKFEILSYNYNIRFKNINDSNLAKNILNKQCKLVNFNI
jgi:hypothetical protein